LTYTWHTTPRSTRGSPTIMMQQVRMKNPGGTKETGQSCHDVQNSPRSDCYTSTIYLTPNMQSTRGHGSRFCIPAGFVDAFRHSFFPVTIRIWNNLPSDVMSPSHEVFKSRLTGAMVMQRQIRSTLFLSPAHLARFYLFCLEFNSCSRHFMHLCHARHYSQEDMCIIGKEEEALCLSIANATSCIILAKFCSM